MQQSSLKKVRSLDHNPEARQRRPGEGGNPPLMHSISIVVEMAKEQYRTDPAADAAFSYQDEMSYQDSFDARGQSSSRKSATRTTSCESADGDQDDDDDETSCLSSDLARKVVLVDEADKIIRSRAQSADSAKLSPESRSPKAERHYAIERDKTLAPRAPPIPARPSMMRSNTLGYSQPEPSAAGSSASSSSRLRQPRLSLSTTCSGQPHSSSECDPAAESISHPIVGLSGRKEGGRASIGSPSGGSELAERGKLGMRRNTHHNVSLTTTSRSMSASPQPAGSMAAIDSSGSRFAQLQFGFHGAKKAASGSSPVQGSAARHLIQQQQQQQPTRLPGHNNKEQNQATLANWSHRRQSLQISLLTGTCGSPTRSLTEEELLGERKFNEQVRNSKSPDLLALQHHHQHHHSHQIPDGQRCQSVTSGELSSSSPTQHQYPLSIVKTNQQHKHSQQRRVSFSSVDPILLPEFNRQRTFFAHNTTALTEQAHHSSADFSQTSPTTPISSSTSDDPPGNQRTSFKPRASCMKPETRLKRHSLASSTAVYNLKHLIQHDDLLKPVRSNLPKPKIPPRSSELRNISAEKPMTLPESARTMHGNSSDNSLSYNITEAAQRTSDAKLDSSTIVTQTSTESDKMDGQVKSEIKPVARQVASTTSQERDANRVQSIMANAKLRQEEFARLLEEHEQIVNEIHRVETKISSSQTNIQQQAKEANERM